MTDSVFSPTFASQLVDYLSQDQDLSPAPTTVFVTAYDDQGNELASDFADARVAVDAGSGWDTDGTTFENTDEIDFGEAVTDVTDIAQLALYDADFAGVEFVRFDIDEIDGTEVEPPFDVSEGTKLRFAPGDVSVDIADYDG